MLGKKIGTALAMVSAISFVSCGDDEENSEPEAISASCNLTICYGETCTGDTPTFVVCQDYKAVFEKSEGALKTSCEEGDEGDERDSIKTASYSTDACSVVNEEDATAKCESQKASQGGELDSFVYNAAANSFLEDTVCKNEDEDDLTAGEFAVITAEVKRSASIEMSSGSTLVQCSALTEISGLVYDAIKTAYEGRSTDTLVITMTEDGTCTTTGLVSTCAGKTDDAGYKSDTNYYYTPDTSDAASCTEDGGTMTAAE